jgi:hypothetical protein
LGFVLYGLFLVLVFEGGARLYWRLTRGVPLLHTAQLRTVFYPELGRLEAQPVSRNDATFDILLLGGSVLNKCCGTVEERLLQELGRRTPMKARIHNLATPAHTSRDSMLKYRELADKAFDLVLVYDGINDVRANNCPRSRFRMDYSHIAWYRSLNALDSAEVPYFALPATVAFGWIQLGDRFGWGDYVPVQQPRQDWLALGRDLKTPPAFRANVAELLELARRRGDVVMLASFASYRAPGYSFKGFRGHILDYGSHAYPIELWGEPDAVMAGLAAHNQVLRELAAAHPEALYVDQDALIPKSGHYFDDVCHFTDAGSAAFAENVAEAILARRLVPTLR